MTATNTRYTLERTMGNVDLLQEAIDCLKRAEQNLYMIGHVKTVDLGWRLGEMLKEEPSLRLGSLFEQESFNRQVYGKAVAK